MAVVATNLIQGPGTLYTGAFGVAEPAGADIDEAPGVGWTDVGGTKDGVELTITQEFEELEVDQLVDIPGRRLTKREFQLTTNFAEPTLENLAIAMNNAAGVTSSTGFKSLEPNSDTSATQPTYVALLLDGYAPEQLRRRIIVRKALVTDDVEFAYKKDEQTVFSVTFSAHYVSSSIKPYKIVDEDPA